MPARRNRCWILLRGSTLAEQRQESRTWQGLGWMCDVLFVGMHGRICLQPAILSACFAARKEGPRRREALWLYRARVLETFQESWSYQSKVLQHAKDSPPSGAFSSNSPPTPPHTPPCPLSVKKWCSWCPNRSRWGDQQLCTVICPENEDDFHWMFLL